MTALIFGESVTPYVLSGLVALLIGLPVYWACRTSDRRIRPRDGFLVVALAWILASLFGAIPYLAEGALEQLKQPDAN